MWDFSSGYVNFLNSWFWFSMLTLFTASLCAVRFVIFCKEELLNDVDRRIGFLVVFVMLGIPWWYHDGCPTAENEIYTVILPAFESLQSHSLQIPILIIIDIICKLTLIIPIIFPVSTKFIANKTNRNLIFIFIKPVFLYINLS